MILVSYQHIALMLRLYAKSYNVFDCMSYSIYATFIMRYVRIAFPYGGIFTSVFEVSFYECVAALLFDLPFITSFPLSFGTNAFFSAGM